MPTVDPARTAGRALAAIAAAAGLVVLAAACGGSSGSHVAQLGSTGRQGGSATAASAPGNGALAFAGCMRSNGVSAYPDPTGSGLAKPSLQQLGVSSSRFQTAETACRHLLPGGGRPPNQAEQQLIRARSLRFAQCVRAHGVPNFPDPGSDGRIPDPARDGIDQASPKFQAANDACGKDRPPYVPSNAAYDAWARTHSSGSGSRALGPP
jgi:hypothetical protein